MIQFFLKKWANIWTLTEGIFADTVRWMKAVFYPYRISNKLIMNTFVNGTKWYSLVYIHSKTDAHHYVHTYCRPKKCVFCMLFVKADRFWKIIYNYVIRGRFKTQPPVARRLLAVRRRLRAVVNFIRLRYNRKIHQVVFTIHLLPLVAKQSSPPIGLN